MSKLESLEKLREWRKHNTWEDGLIHLIAMQREIETKEFDEIVDEIQREVDVFFTEIPTTCTGTPRMSAADAEANLKWVFDCEFDNFDYVKEHYMKLPVDADGVPIHIGDYLQLGETHGEVVALTYCPANGELPWEWQCDTGDWYNTAFAHHTKPRTVEDVLGEYRSECEQLVSSLECGVIDAERYRQRLVDIGEKYAAELMLRGDA